MDTEYSFSDYQRMSEEIRNKNSEYLNGFEEHLQAQGLKDKTISKHLFNVSFYINTYLLNYDALDVKRGCYEVSNFLGGWFIRKAMWSTVGTIKSNIASFKKFYSYLLGIGVIEQDDYDDLYDTILYSKDDWFDLVDRYNDPDEDNPFFPI